MWTGAGPGCKCSLGQEAPLRAQLMVHSGPPFLFLLAQPSSDPWPGFGGNYPLFGYFSPHLVSSTCSPTEQRSATGAQRRGRSTKGGRWLGAAQIQPISRTNLSQGLCSVLLHFKGLQKSSCSKGFSPSNGKASTACEIKE